MRGLILLVLLGAAGVLIYGQLGGLGQRLPISVDTLLAATPIPVPAVKDVAPKAEATGNEVAVEIGEAELTRQLNQQLAGRPLGETLLGPASLERIDVSLRGGRLEANGTARLGSTSVGYSSHLTATPVANGGVKVGVADAKVGGFPLPDVARTELESSAQREIDRLLARQPMRVRSIEIGDGRLRAIGTPLR